MRGESMVELKNISFRYGSEERQEYGENSLSGINLSIHDGEFVLKFKELLLHWKGSSNQRVIRVPETLKTGKIVLYED